MGKRHLATVLIGAGVGNMTCREAIRGWLQGIAHALTGSVEEPSHLLRQVTFVELKPQRVLDIHAALQAEIESYQGTLKVDFEPFTPATLASLGRAADKFAQARWRQKHSKAGQQQQQQREEQGRLAPTRLTIELDQDTYRLGAVTETASVPERKIAIDPRLVMQANDELAGEGNASLQRERGEFLGKLLVPSELRTQLTSTAPIIMTMDSNTARIHWEMVSHVEMPIGNGANGDGLAQLTSFLGTSRGFTRQLRTAFAPPPEPPPPPRRVLRVLIVADPAADAHLPGAEAEGAEIAELFRAFNTVYSVRSGSRVEVKTLFGPSEATRTNVLRELMTKSYDVLHFAGHCVYNSKAPSKSGWIFTDGDLLAANELSRVDRIPKFVFSNACESGITPDRSDRRTAALAPSFAEAFFAQGVANFVCTAWPVDDTAARDFALTMYAGLLGLRASDTNHGKYTHASPLMMFEAMREARRKVALCEYGARTWGAYQHYGNPYLQLFDAASLVLTDRAKQGNGHAVPGSRGPGAEGSGKRTRRNRRSMPRDAARSSHKR